MESNNKIGTLNTYDLITKFLNRPNITNHISKHLSSATMKPVDAVFSSVINDSFIILKFQENPKSSQYFKYLPYSDTYDRLDISSSKSIVDIGYNNSCFYYILSIGNTFSIVTPNNEVKGRSLIFEFSHNMRKESAVERYAAGNISKYIKDLLNKYSESRNLTISFIEYKAIPDYYN